ncbi:head-to-tail stopper [Microbacterium phage Gingerbug]|nr:head-to-tail stopper [Microbacterium phage Gingerbug]
MADDFTEAFEEWLTATVTVRTFLGPGPKGPRFTDPVSVGPTEDHPGVMVKDGNRLVRGSDTEERMSDASLVMPLVHAAHFEPESEVTLPDGRVRVVVSRSSDRVGLPLAHCRVVLS